MNDIIQIIITVVCSVLASSGLWAVILSVINRKMDEKDAKTQMLIGLGHDRITYLGLKYLERDPQYITEDEYENLIDYLYKPYSELGGNGSAQRIIEEVKKIKIYKDPPENQSNNNGSSGGIGKTYMRI